MKATGVIIARFQTPYLHDGHKYLLDELRSKHNKVVVVLGVSPVKGSRRNPFDFYTREKLLKQYAPELMVRGKRIAGNDEGRDHCKRTPRVSEPVIEKFKRLI